MLISGAGTTPEAEDFGDAGQYTTNTVLAQNSEDSSEFWYTEPKPETIAQKVPLDTSATTSVSGDETEEDYVSQSILPTKRFRMRIAAAPKRHLGVITHRRLIPVPYTNGGHCASKDGWLNNVNEQEEEGKPEPKVAWRMTRFKKGNKNLVRQLMKCM